MTPQTTQTWRIGDCMDLLPGIDTGSIDMILCDMPYGTTACSWDTIIPLAPLWKEWKRIITDHGAIVLTASQPFTTTLISSNMEMFKYCWVWKKSRITGFLLAKKQPLRNCEDVCVFYKKQCVYNPQFKTVKKRTFTRTKGGGIYREQNNIPNESNNDGIENPYSLLEIPSINGQHPTQKPVALFEYLIKTYTNEGNLVHDSCLGSGTTLEACRRTNRNCVGFEIDPQWEHLYADRCMAHTPALTSYFGEE